MYKFRKMLIGLCNSGATFQRLMDVALSGLHFHVCLVYVDDVILFSATAEEHQKKINYCVRTSLIDRVEVEARKMRVVSEVGFLFGPCGV